MVGLKKGRHRIEEVSIADVGREILRYDKIALDWLVLGRTESCNQAISVADQAYQFVDDKTDSSNSMQTTFMRLTAGWQMWD